MAASLEIPSPTHLHKESPHLLMGSPNFSPSSDRRFWSTLHGRVDALLDDHNSKISSGKLPPNHDRPIKSYKDSGRSKRLKDDTLLLMRGFDSVAHTLSQLSNHLDNALQGANDLAKPPTLTEIFHSSLKESASNKDEVVGKQENELDPNKGLKRKYETSHCSEDQEEGPRDEKEQDPKDGKLNKAKNLAVTMATKAASLAREMKLIKSDLCFMQERCSLLEEENRRLRDGFAKGIRPDEDDLVRLQLETLLAEKSRLANENANLVRENQCLNQLVEYHQLASEDFSSYEQVVQGMCLDFSSPPRLVPGDHEQSTDEDHGDSECFQTPAGKHFGFATPDLDECENHTEGAAAAVP
ncbi:uncharacterized protein LOC115703628 [Cannabis sativa]|uniref:uncharacterized protein LOC115703628 n=1 Tax=Cannabis sativa TaxID=3483 RepID=UPI0029C9F99D|nr:uncharacterized protein LOC115703628 [Cannabis sativa]